ncbi:unnamed protein product, partial [Brassica rapa]
TDGVLSEPISVLVEAAVAVTSRDENDVEDDVPEDKGSESLVERDKDGDKEEKEDDDKGKIFCITGITDVEVNVTCRKQSKKCGSLSIVFPSVCEGKAEGIKEKEKKGTRSFFV